MKRTALIIRRQRKTDGKKIPRKPNDIDHKEEWRREGPRRVFRTFGI
jgi:hypothetical protein